MKTTEEKVINWANEKGLIFPENSTKQFLKTIEEIGEVSNALLKNDIENLKLEIGDVLVTLTILAATKNLSLTDCFESAYQKISNRTGKTVDGNFFKN